MLSLGRFGRLERTLWVGGLVDATVFVSGLLSALEGLRIGSVSLKWDRGHFSAFRGVASLVDDCAI